MWIYFLQRSFYRRSHSANSTAAPFFIPPPTSRGLLVVAEAGQLALRHWPTHQQWERCLRCWKSRGDYRCDRLAHSGLLLLCLLVKQFDCSPGQLLESCRSLWRVSWTILALTHRGPEQGSWHSLADHSPLRRRYQQWKPSQWDSLILRCFSYFAFW